MLAPAAGGGVGSVVDITVEIVVRVGGVGSIFAEG
jgi:hypothetical protein